MIDITILGNESYNSLKLENICNVLIADNQYQADVKKITETSKIDPIYRRSLPVLIINEQVFSTGKVPSEQKIKFWIDELLKEYFY